MPCDPATLNLRHPSYRGLLECQTRPQVEVEDPHLPRQTVRPHCRWVKAWKGHAGAHWATHVFKFSALWIMFQGETLRLIASIERFALKVGHHNKRIELVSMGFNFISSHNFQYYPCASFSARHRSLAFHASAGGSCAAGVSACASDCAAIDASGASGSCGYGQIQPKKRRTTDPTWCNIMQPA